MKKVVRTVWVSLLSGLALLVACTCTKGLSRTEKRQLKAERTSLMNELDKIHQNTADILDPEALLVAKKDEMNILYQIDEINGMLKDEKAQKEGARQLGITIGQIDSLNQVIQNKQAGDEVILPCVYGPPTDDSQMQKDQHRKDLMERLTDLSAQFNKLQSALKRREGACVYGSPEVIERYKKETNRLRHETDSINQEIQNVEDELNKLLDDE